MEVKVGQDELAEVVKDCCHRINQFADYLKAFKGIEIEDKASTVQDTTEAGAQADNDLVSPDNTRVKDSTDDTKTDTVINSPDDTKTDTAKKSPG